MLLPVSGNLPLREQHHGRMNGFSVWLHHAILHMQSRVQGSSGGRNAAFAFPSQKLMNFITESFSASIS